ncbi:MAG: hypothetical protein JXA36_03440 [Coriobacteriia bacterium]|nr:hypothetical protein [Coriobacteriia bacterium]
MVFGTYELTMTDTGTIELPAEVADDLGPNVVLFKGVRGTLVLCPENRFEGCLSAVMESEDRGARERKRFAAGGAYATELGPRGELEIPEHLAWYAELNRDLTLQCLGAHCAIVNRAG